MKTRRRWLLLLVVLALFAALTATPAGASFLSERINPDEEFTWGHALVGILLLIGALVLCGALTWLTGINFFSIALQLLWLFAGSGRGGMTLGGGGRGFSGGGGRFGGGGASGRW